MRKDAGNLIGNLMHNLYHANRAIIRAGRAGAPEQENMQLRFFGSSLAIMGIINAAVAFQSFINQLTRNLANPIPTYMNAILSVVHGFTFFSGITALVIGWLFLVKDNPRQHRHLAENILLLIQFASVIALGSLLLVCSSSG